MNSDAAIQRCHILVCLFKQLKNLLNGARFFKMICILRGTTKFSKIFEIRSKFFLRTRILARSRTVLKLYVKYVIRILKIYRGSYRSKKMTVFRWFITGRPRIMYRVLRFFIFFSKLVPDTICSQNFFLNFHPLKREMWYRD